MRPADKLIQQLIDGESTAAEAATAQHLLDADSSLSSKYKFLSDIDLMSKVRAGRITANHTADSLVSMRIMERLDHVSPGRRVHVEMGTAIAALLLSSVFAAAFGVVGTMDDLLPLAWMALAAIAGGLVLVVGLGRLRPQNSERATLSSGRLRAPTPPSLLRRTLGYRFALGDGELLLYRAVGCILLVGGCYLAIKGLA